MKEYGDNRGYFMETYKKKDFDEAGLVYDFIQDKVVNNLDIFKKESNAIIANRYDSWYIQGIYLEEINK